MKKITSVILLSILIFVLAGCNLEGDKGTGKLKDVEAYMNAKTNDKVTEVELINTETIPEQLNDHEFNLDGAVFYNGKDEITPEHNEKTFRAFSKKLDSYVFLTFNEYSKQYNMIQNYYISEEKQGALELTSLLQDIMKTNQIRIKTLSYSKFTHEKTDLNDVYKLPSDYDISNYTHLVPLWIVVTVDSSANDIRSIKNKIQDSINTMKEYISIDIKTSDFKTITFFKDGHALIYDSGDGGLKSDF
ncbi:hypothetical protein [[Clostridium] fimetarium]|uniref:Lipoprotein n=1 Tax=[Clostridium] fimetarium TaxID=99656 RepID=A0A1I0RY93_9FIRM|nr:hypothetical protein [[Clostridium] fimetarium]SEW46625.1 hypothetical protein SAMN05421659_1367 [[Clostridium] fimetarium]